MKQLTRGISIKIQKEEVSDILQCPTCSSNWSYVRWLSTDDEGSQTQSPNGIRTRRIPEITQEVGVRSKVRTLVELWPDVKTRQNSARISQFHFLSFKIENHLAHIYTCIPIILVSIYADSIIKICPSNSCSCMQTIFSPIAAWFPLASSCVSVC